MKACSKPRAGYINDLRLSQCADKPVTHGNCVCVHVADVVDTATKSAKSCWHACVHLQQWFGGMLREFAKHVRAEPHPGRSFLPTAENLG